MNKKNKDKLPIATMIITTVVTAIILAAIFQFFIYSPLKNERSQAKKHLAESNGIIVDLRNLLQNKESELKKFKADTANQSILHDEKSKFFQKEIARLNALIDEITSFWNSFEGNFCTDKNIIALTLRWCKARKIEAEK